MVINSFLKTLIIFIFLTLISEISGAQVSMSKTNSSLPIYISSDTLNVEREKSTATFQGNVRAQQGDFTLSSETLIVYYHEKSKKTKENSKNNISKLVAKNHVVITSPEEKVNADTATYNVDTGIIHLNDHVVLHKDNSVLNGSKLVYNVNTGQSTLDNNIEGSNKPGRVKGVFVPNPKKSK